MIYLLGSERVNAAMNSMEPCQPARSRSGPKCLAVLLFCMSKDDSISLLNRLLKPFPKQALRFSRACRKSYHKNTVGKRDITHNK